MSGIAPIISADMQSIYFELPVEYDFISDFVDGYGVLEKDGKWILIDNVDTGGALLGWYLEFRKSL